MPERKPARRGVEIAIPGRKRPLRIEHVVFDFNGTLAVEGRLVRAATVVARDIDVAIDLLLKPQRLVATLRK